MADTKTAHVWGIDNGSQATPSKGVRNFVLAKSEFEIDALDMRKWCPRILARIWLANSNCSVDVVAHRL
ncbi:uncharacterized protein PHACADRAFT_265704, partial [Phanerochaete carnosa HHB-10118-sp]